MTKRKKTKAKSNDHALPVLGRLGAEQWIAVRQKSGAGPMEPVPRRGTRTEREREALQRELDTRPEQDV
jgi:hypothetical protein